MKRILLFAAAAMICAGSFAQPKGMPPRSTYDQVDEVRKELNLDHDQFEKVYSAYEKYNKSIFGDVDNNNRPTPPPGGRPGGPRPGNGNGNGPDFGGGRPGSHPGFDAQRPGNRGSESLRPGNGKPADLEKMEKKRAKAEEKLCKSMKKIFKKDPAAYSRWEVIRNRQLKQMAPMPPASAPQ